MEELLIKHIRIINETDLSFQRNMINNLPWAEKLIGIKGSRGVGKTTLLLQYIKMEYGQSNKALYVSLDDLYFSENTLIDFVESFVANGGEHLFLDEVHKYNNWSIELKNIYDTHKKLRVVFTGSSLLEILNSRSDLSRRALVYEMQGLSYREYLNFTLKTDFERIDFHKLLKNPNDFALKIGEEIKPLQYFSDYLKVGYFPFYNGSEVLYYKKLQEMISMIIEIELPLLRNTGVSIISKIKQLLYVISQAVPFKPNVTQLASKIGITRKTLLEYLNYLNDANVFNTLHKNSHGIGLLQKPEKLFLENTNFLYAIKHSAPNVGSVRETFFLNQMLENHQVTYPENGDFLVDDKYLFEVGGKGKDYKQIAGIKNSFIAADNMEVAVGNKIPLWLFGFLY